MPTRKHKNSKNEDFNFEHTRQRLESIAELLEGEDTALTISMQAFEEGVKLIREAQEYLESLEQRVRVISQNGTTSDPEETTTDP